METQEKKVTDKEKIAIDKKGNLPGKTKWLFAAVAVILLVYLAGVLWFSFHFCWNSTVNGMDLSGKTVGSIAEDIAGYQLEVTEMQKDRSDYTETISGEAIGFQLKKETGIKELIGEQNQFLWFLPVKRSYEKEEWIVIDDAKLQQTVNALKGFDKEFYEKPTDAALSEYIKGTGYEIIPEQNGNQLNLEKVCEAVKTAALDMETKLNLVESDCYEMPSVKQDDADLKEWCDKLNQYLHTEITYEFGDHTEVVDADVIYDWLIVADGEVELSEAAVADYVTSLRKEYDTIFTNREFMTSYGTEITVSGGDYGWWMNTDEETEELYEMIEKGESGSRTPIYRQTAAAYGEQDYGNSYVEINLTAQHLFLYKDGEKILESDFVSGNTAKGNGTPVGTYGITYKERNAVLKGETYQTPVSFWMPFNGNVGMHDATWRKEFGGNIYKTSGAHGCINLPYEIAQQIYEVIEKGMPVMCYELPGTEPVVENPKEQLTQEESTPVTE
ncbi:MAG: L,D-transpeptidase family protein [Lachnospiraceae bacterium]|nr:L,D-transpeptidase family protein [Lachnospiraceae bacterium]